MMSEQEKKSGSSVGSVVMVEKTASSRHKPYRPNELQDESPPDLHKRSRAPAVPSVAEELKDTTVNQPPTTMDRVEGEREPSSNKHMHVTKNIPSSKRHGTTEEIAMVAIESKKDNIGAPPQPIPHHSLVADASNLKGTLKNLDKKADDDSITEDITELRTSEAAKEHSEWSDDEEAGGLPRTESRASRVSRAMRQLFCCGVAYQAPSEDDMSARDLNGI